jgi:hypothetical protein
MPSTTPQLCSKSDALKRWRFLVMANQLCSMLNILWNAGLGYVEPAWIWNCISPGCIASNDKVIPNNARGK